MDVITRHRLGQLGLDACAVEGHAPRRRGDAVYAKFLERIPFENLSHQRVCHVHPDDPSIWPRTTDCLLRENRRHGLGGTSFTLAYALRDLLRGVGINAHCALGRNLVTEEAHAVVLAYLDDQTLLYDPSLLVGGAVPVHPGAVLDDPLGPLRLRAGGGATLRVAVTMRGEPERDVYDLVPAPAPPIAYRQAWIASFWRGRPRPLLLGCRRGTEIRRFSEGCGTLEILRPEGTERRAVGPAPVDALEACFGIARSCLEAFYAGRAGGPATGGATAPGAP